MAVYSASFARLTSHNPINPFTSPDARDDIAKGVGNIQQTDNDARVVVWLGRESLLYGQVEAVKAEKADCSIKYTEGDGWELEVATVRSVYGR
jgi:hypothetical protein